jgi:quinoprotein glucose dehydrogenase
VNPENWPGWFDRVVGLWRPLPMRPPDAARDALASHLESLISDPSEEIALAAIDAAVKLRLTNAAPALLRRMSTGVAGAALRRRIPPALAALDENALRSAIPLALRDTNEVLRAAILPYLDRLNGDAAIETLRPIVRGAITAGGQRNTLLASDLRLIQAALGVLARMHSPQADSLVQELLIERNAGHYPATLELDLLEAAANRENPDIKTALNARVRSTNDEFTAWAPALLGGDPDRGKAIFFEKVEVQCSRCHQVKREGGTVGPALDSVGRRLSRQAILESILQPNKVIAPGYESVLLTLKNGQDISGTVKKETADELVLESLESGVTTVRKTTIAERRRSLSAMPEALTAFLTKRELRDLIEYLATLRSEAR